MEEMNSNEFDGASVDLADDCRMERRLGSRTSRHRPIAKYFVDAKPRTHQGDLRQLHPAVVKRLVPLPNWVNWKWELNEKAPPGPRCRTSRVIRPGMRDHSKKRTWGTFAEAVANVEASKADGIGFCLFETNICAFDIDDCRDIITGKIVR